MVPPQLAWSRDGKLLYLALMGGSAVVAIPLPAGKVLPALPPTGLRSMGEALMLRGAKMLAVPAATPGPNASIYAYPKFTAHRNIYRVS